MFNHENSIENCRKLIYREFPLAEPIIAHHQRQSERAEVHGDTIIYNTGILLTEEECGVLTDALWTEYSVNNFKNWNWEYDNEIGPYWQVPHDGDTNTVFANIQLINSSTDPDTSLNGEMDNLTTIWNRSTPAEPFDDVDSNDVYDYGEPFDDINNNGYYDWSEAIDVDILTTRSTAGVHTVQLIVEDPYGYTDTTEMVIDIKPEPNESPVASAGEDVIVFLTQNDEKSLKSA